MGKKETTFERIEKNLFKDRKEASFQLSPKEIAIKERLMLCVSKKLEDPLIEDSELVTFLIHGCEGCTEPVSKSQAYRDVAMVSRLVGNVQLAAKSWYRYMIVEGSKKAYNLAIKKEDAKGAAACLDKIGKYTRSDKEDDAMDWTQLIPPNFEPSDDVTLLEGLEELPNLEEERANFRALFKSQLQQQAVDVKPLEEDKLNAHTSTAGN